MKSGLTITEMAQEIERQCSVKKDYLVKTSSMEMESMGGPPMLRVIENGVDQVEPLTIQETAHRQLGTHLSIPWKYYERMLQDDPGLLAYNVNRWLQRQAPTQRMLRTIDGRARAFLSNRYRCIDNYDIAMAVLPIIGEMQGARFESCQLTENYMYIKVVNPRLTGEVRVGDIVQAGVVISNSETGLGADGKAFMIKVQDTVRAAVNEAQFTKVLNQMKDSTQVKLNTADIPSVVKLASSSFGITEAESQGVFQHLIEDGDYTLYGLANAVTRFSQDVEDYDRASKLEEIGYSVMTMHPRLLKQINQVTRMAA